MRTLCSTLALTFSFSLLSPLLSAEEATASEAEAPVIVAEQPNEPTPRPRPRVQFDPGQQEIGGEALLRQYLQSRAGAETPDRNTGNDVPPEWLVFDLAPFTVTDGDDLAERSQVTRELLADAWNRLSTAAKARIAAEKHLDAADRMFFNRFVLPWGISPEQRALAEEERIRRVAWRADRRRIADTIGGDLGDEIRAEMMLDEYLRK